jgi:hypothetical protein
LVEKKTNKFKETPSAEFDFEILFVPASWLWFPFSSTLCGGLGKIL